MKQFFKKFNGRKFVRTKICPDTKYINMKSKLATHVSRMFSLDNANKFKWV